MTLTSMSTQMLFTNFTDMYMSSCCCPPTSTLRRAIMKMLLALRRCSTVSAGRFTPGMVDWTSLDGGISFQVARNTLRSERRGWGGEREGREREREREKWKCYMHIYMNRSSMKKTSERHTSTCTTQCHFTQSSIFHKKYIHGNLSTKVEYINIVFDSNLQVGERAHLHDWATSVDREGGVGRLVRKKRRLHCQRRGWDETKAEG